MSHLTPDTLNEIRDRMQRGVILRDGEGRAKIVVHMGTCGIASGAKEILATFKEGIGSPGDEIILTTSGCAGLCKHEPMATVQLAGQAPVKYIDLTPAKVKKIITEHVTNGTMIDEYALAVGSERLS